MPSSLSLFLTRFLLPLSTTNHTESELTAALGTEARRSASAVAQLSEERDLLSRTLHAANQDVAKLR
jgi:hypothetical protein